MLFTYPGLFKILFKILFWKLNNILLVKNMKGSERNDYIVIVMLTFMLLCIKQVL